MNCYFLHILVCKPLTVSAEQEKYQGKKFSCIGTPSTNISRTRDNFKLISLGTCELFNGLCDLKCGLILKLVVWLLKHIFCPLKFRVSANYVLGKEWKREKAT